MEALDLFKLGDRELIGYQRVSLVTGFKSFVCPSDAPAREQFAL